MRESGLDNYLNEIEELLRHGLARRGRARLRALQPRRLDRGSRLRVASLLRRAGETTAVLRLLNPLVRPPPRSAARATSGEIAEYAATLTRIGAAKEALDLLQPLDAKVYPEIPLFRAYAFFSQWRYAEAIPLLEQYVRMAKDSYWQTLGMVNLAAALVYERHTERADALLAQLSERTTKMDLKLLHANTLEISAQQAIYAKKWAKAEGLLDRAKTIVGDLPMLDELYIRKWIYVLNLRKNPKSATHRKAMAELKRAATERGHWETLRDCDRHLAIATKDAALCLRVYFGTPFLSYRDRLLEEFPTKIKVPDEYFWDLGRKESAVCSALVGQPLGDGSRLKVGQLKHRLLGCLASDFYRPLRVATLFDELYPGEYYNPISSPNRVHQAVRELKMWLADARAPLDIREDHGSYRLCGGRWGCRLRVPAPGWWEKNSSDSLSRLRSAAGTALFTVQQASRWLKIPARTLRHQLSKAVEDSVVEKLGSGRSTRYRLR